MKWIALIVGILAIGALIHDMTPKYPTQVPCETLAFKECMSKSQRGNEDFCSEQAARIATSLENKVCTTYE